MKLENIITFDDIFNAYLDAKKHKASSQSFIEFNMNLSYNLYNLYEDLISGAYEISYSTCFIVSKPKLREIFAANFRDRIVQHLVIKKLLPYIEEELIPNAFSCMKGRGTLYGIKKLSNTMKKYPNGWVAKFDIKNFFMSINKKLLYKIIKSFIKSKIKNKKLCSALCYLSKIIILHHPELMCIKKGNLDLWNRLDPGKSLFTNNPDCGLAIGNITSQLFANLFLNAFDHFMYSKFGNRYGRYVDDFYIVTKTKKEILDIIPEMERELLKIGLELHRNKRYIQPVCRGCKFVGSVVKGSRIYTGNGTISNARKKLHFYNKISKITLSKLIKFQRSINSYLGFMINFREYKNRIKFINQISNKWKKYFKPDKYNRRIILRDEYKLLKCIF